MASWTVKLIKGEHYAFADLLQRIGQYYELQSAWVQKLQAHIKAEPKYEVHLNLIDSVQGPNGETLVAPFLLLLITKTKLTITLLGELTENDTGHVIGVWPEKFLKILETDEKAILNLLYIIVEQPSLIEKIELTF